jgi:hypothetical protein
MRNEVTGRSKPVYPWDNTIERTGMAGRGKFAMLIVKGVPHPDARNSPGKFPRVMAG